MPGIVRVIAAMELPLSAHSTADGGPPEPITHDVEGYAKFRQLWFDRLGVGGASPNGFHIDVSAIRSDLLLDRLIDSSVESSDLENPTGLNGDSGFVVTVDGEAVSQPQCCGSFRQSLDEWNRVLLDQSGDWSMLWIGHPWHMVRVIDSNIELTVAADGDEHPTPAAILPLV